MIRVLCYLANTRRGLIFWILLTFQSWKSVASWSFCNWNMNRDIPLSFTPQILLSHITLSMIPSSRCFRVGKSASPCPYHGDLHYKGSFSWGGMHSTPSWSMSYSCTSGSKELSANRGIQVETSQKLLKVNGLWKKKLEHLARIVLLMFSLLPFWRVTLTLSSAVFEFI